jgi:hypothetical protein
MPARAGRLYAATSLASQAVFSWEARCAFMLTAFLKPSIGSGEMKITGNKALVATPNAQAPHIDLIKDKIFRAITARASLG